MTCENTACDILGFMHVHTLPCAYYHCCAWVLGESAMRYLSRDGVAQMGPVEPGVQVRQAAKAPGVLPPPLHGRHLSSSSLICLSLSLFLCRRCQSDIIQHACIQHIHQVARTNGALASAARAGARRLNDSGMQATAHRHGKDMIALALLSGDYLFKRHDYIPLRTPALSAALPPERQAGRHPHHAQHGNPGCSALLSHRGSGQPPRSSP